MSGRVAARFQPGRNIAMKVPPHQYEATLAFYGEVLGLARVSGTQGGAVAFAFGPMVLWIDRVAPVSQAELWLEVTTDDTDAAAEALAAAGVVRCDAVEPLDGFDGFWISSPASIVHLVSAAHASWAPPDAG